MNDHRIYIFDTTLRDGQQSPGAGMSYHDNLIFADLANDLQIDALEAGFPAASKTDYKIVYDISKRMTEKNSSMRIAGLCQLRKEQLVITMESLVPSQSIGKARVHMYLPVDPNLMMASLGKRASEKQALIDEVFNLTKMAVDAGYEVEFSAEGYSRMGNNFDFTTDILRATTSAGAFVINCPDTIGGAYRLEGENFFVRHMQRHSKIIKEEFPNSDIIWSTHCHNDFGLAVENTMSAIFEGPARQIEVCINGVGERAGNAALEQCLMLIKQFGSAKKPTGTFLHKHQN